VNHIGFAVNDIDASAVRLKGDAVKFSLEPRDKLNQYGHRIAYVVGPSDVKIELVQHITCILREDAGPTAGYKN
jgi:catechol 2,3-dioxygenase-like lactoylglutathione lyase family enzyme